MKKLFLLIASFGFTATTFAQSAKGGSIVFVPGVVKEEASARFPAEKQLSKRHSSNAANKTTAPGGSWFSYIDIMSSTSTQGYYYPLYNDSNVVITSTSGGGNFNISTFGMGVSFDPTDSVYFGGDANGSTSAGAIQDFAALPTFRVYNTNDYTIDSVDFLGKYVRTQNYTDTLIIQLAKSTGTTGFGVYSLQFTTADANGYAITPDGKPRFTTAIYNPANNRISDSVTASNRVTITKILDAAYFADSSSNGYHKTTFALPTAMNVSAGETVIAYVTFRSGNAYPLGTNQTAANTFRTYAYEMTGQNAPVKQTVGSYTSGLVATRQSKYVPPYTSFTYQGHNVLIPSVAYAADAGNDYPYFSLYVKCPTCPTLGVNNVKNTNITSVSAYPNPANDEVKVKFNLKDAANTTVTIANTVGQVVISKNMGNVNAGEATFSTSNLANGVYFYTVEANGQRTTNRFVVSH
ncbi:MAG: T9SS type A sorting domain-containing protein [Flavipsychrobacter sp.]|nr:T9SS type A sorting domain-containing protein [Flavipsychrobacter sp.]